MKRRIQNSWHCLFKLLLKTTQAGARGMGSEIGFGKLEKNMKREALKLIWLPEKNVLNLGVGYEADKVAEWKINEIEADKVGKRCAGGDRDEIDQVAGGEGIGCGGRAIKRI